MKFIFLYHGCSLLLLCLVKLLPGAPSMEIFAGLLWYYLESLVLGLVLSSIVWKIFDRKVISPGRQMLINALMCILLINLFSWISYRGFATGGLIAKLREGVDFYDTLLLIHVIAIAGFLISSLTRKYIFNT
ncbi:hypothetical protein [Chitinophaga arvensicola]|uniref:Uncharacterized protein n=1 Tax=Chitinophaga arvensicola TaxID=29529 RepID=A0A1I0RPV5_9BACT|nr:hypothetical protein [Chitinophaga arvensicola]SEW43387.1 hypothetical protein SAMN04488122_3214 [Chitinophaga arvensicola]